MNGLDLFELVRNGLAVIGTLLTVGFGAWIVIQKGRVDKEAAASGEWKELAEVRGDRIEDMEGHIRALENRVATLEGQYQALLELKADAIAGRVVEILVATNQARTS